MHELFVQARLRRYGLRRHATIFSHTTLGERLALFDLARALPPRSRAIEIGSHIGSSALFICAGLKDRGGHLICVDTWMNETMPDGRNDTFAEFEANTEPYRDLITSVRKLSNDLTEEDIGGPLDFAFIDGDHSEEAVRGDFLLLAPRIKIGGTIAFHDSGDAFPGVNVVIGESLASGSWTLTKFEHSLAALRKIKA